MNDLIVVGGGIIGATIAAHARRNGMQTLVLDDKRPESGTYPSGGHLKPSWFGSLKKAEYEPALALLSEVWGMTEEKFKVWPTFLRTFVFRVDTDKVLAAPREIKTVIGVTQFKEHPTVFLEGGEELECRKLVVAAGAWSAKLVKGVELTLKRGVSFRLAGHLAEQFIKPWAPYKQIVAHQQTPEVVWVGDGSALLPENWAEERTAQCLGRCMSACGSAYTLLEARHGLRPYTKSGSDPCFFAKVGPNTWVITGAGKSGTIAAGWAARRFLHEC